MTIQKLLIFILVFHSWMTLFGQTDSSAVDIERADSLNYYTAKLDSIQNEIQDSLLVLTQQYDSVKNISSRAIDRLQQKADSLTAINLPQPALLQKIDSVRAWRDDQLGKITLRTDTIRTKVMAKIETLKLPSPLKKQASKLISQVNGFDISMPGTLTDLSLVRPDIDIPAVDVPSLPGVPDMDVGLETPEVLPDELGQINEYAGAVPGNADELGTMVENQAVNLDELSALETGIEEVEQANALPEMDMEGQSEQLKQQAVKKAVNHFKGKETQLQEAMNRMAEYKKKYSSVESLKDLPKRPPNAMKGKPFVERLVPGISLQVLRNNDWMIDLNPHVGYRISGKITAGIGWNQRIAYNFDQDEFNTDARVYGPRVYGTFMWKKGYGVEGVAEYLNVPVRHPLYSNRFVHRKWLPGVMGGIRKEYRITRSLRGNLRILYNLYDPDYKSPYGDRLVVRMGMNVMLRKGSSK